MLQWKALQVVIVGGSAGGDQDNVVAGSVNGGQDGAIE